MVKIYLANTLLFSPQTGPNFIHSDSTTGELSVEWLSDPNKLYTLVVYDIDAKYLHLLITNIPGNNIDKGNTVISWQAPNPPKTSLPHKYYVNIYSQDDSKINIDNSTITRVPFNLNSFVNKYDLKLIDSGNFTSGYNVPTKATVNKTNKTNDSNLSNNYFILDTSLPENKQKWCRCVIKVAAKQTKSCLEDKAWYQVKDGKSCYNPYAVCSASVGTSSRECGKNYQFSNFSDDELKAYGYLHKDLDVPVPYNRSQMLSNISTWKAAKSK